MHALYTLIHTGLSLSAGTAYAYLSPGEVFPDLQQIQDKAAQEPVQALPVLSDAIVPAEAAMPLEMLYIVAALIAVVCACVLFRKKAPKIANSDVIPPTGEV